MCLYKTTAIIRTVTSIVNVPSKPGECVEKISESHKRISLRPKYYNIGGDFLLPLLFPIERYHLLYIDNTSNSTRHLKSINIFK